VRPSRLPRRSPEKAFESLYRSHFREIFGYALALLHSPVDAEDATQATFLNAYRALERGERPRHAASWLRAIALNVCREQFRRASRRPDEVSLEEDPGDLVAEAPEPAIGDVIRALSHLPFNQRAALVMREFEGRSVAEIAGLLEVSSSAVETLLFRARRTLREQLEGSLGCDEAERAISRQLDGALPRGERGALRAHLRECPECASLARRLRAQSSSLKSLALVPAPATLVWSKLTLPGAAGGASTAAGASLVTAGAAPVAVKAVGATLLSALAVGAGSVALEHHGSRGSARGGGGGAPPGAVKDGTSPSVRVGTAATVGALNARAVEPRRAGSMRAAHHKDATRGPATRSPGHSASGASANAGSAGSQQSGAPQTPGARGASSSSSSSSGHGQRHAYGRSGGNGHVSAGSATSKPHPPTRQSSAHGQSRGNGRGLGYGHTDANGHGRPGLATSERHSSTGPPTGQAQPSGTRSQHNAK
jgi:RNA polymerase sigma factor (sigma-70 family)